jgi:hypothetical protein
MLKVKIRQKTKLQLYQQEFEGEMITMITKIFIAKHTKKWL